MIWVHWLCLVLCRLLQLLVAFIFIWKIRKKFIHIKKRFVWLYPIINDLFGCRIFLSPYSSFASGLSGGAWRNFCIFPLRRKSCLSVSEFFFFRKNVKILALERQPALFLFVSFSFVRTKGKRKTIAQSQKSSITKIFLLQTFSFWWQKEKVISNILHNPIFLLNLQRSKTNPFFRKEESWWTETEIFTHGDVLIAI